VPGKIVKSTGTISADRKMVTWRPKMGKKTNLATTVDLPSVPWTLIGGAAAFLIALLIALFVIRSQKKAKMTPLTNETPPAEEPPLLQTEPF
jgi:galactokinase/mevalonate kinase-like predicted kinase